MLKCLYDLQEIVIINVLEPRGADLAAGLVCLSSAKCLTTDLKQNEKQTTL
jgi:hypothetical protein